MWAEIGQPPRRYCAQGPRLDGAGPSDQQVSFACLWLLSWMRSGFLYLESSEVHQAGCSFTFKPPVLAEARSRSVETTPQLFYPSPLDKGYRSELSIPSLACGFQTPLTTLGGPKVEMQMFPKCALPLRDGPNPCPLESS
jgi:hypothetical protein